MIELSDLLASVPAVILGDGPSQFTGATTNSRDAAEGSLFFALSGGSRDGHDFVADAVGAGARGVVVERPVPGIGPGVAVVRVPNTLDALQLLGQATRRRFGASVVAVTGSAGKTTTKGMVAHVLGTRFNVLSNRASFNNHLGVPLTLLEMNSGHSHVVAEVGTNRRGEIAALTRLAEPDVGVVTGVGLAHIGNFASREELAEEKTDLLRGVRPGGEWVVNGDDEYLLAAARTTPAWDDAEVIRVGFGPGNEIRAAAVRVDEFGTTGVVTADGEAVPFSLAVSGRHFVYAALFAVAVGRVYGIDVVSGVQALRGFVAPPGRAAVHRLTPRLLVLDDSYNASPDATLAALDLLGGMNAAVRVAVLGQMRELGDASASLHEAVGARAASAATHLVAVGSGCQELLEGARRAGLRAERMWLADSAKDAYETTREITAAADPDADCAVLVKGSRFTHTERVHLGLAGSVVGCSLPTCTLYINCSACPKLATG